MKKFLIQLIGTLIISWIAIPATIIGLGVSGVLWEKKVKPWTIKVLSPQQQNAEKDSQIALRDTNTYMDQKTLELYKYFGGEIKDVRAELGGQKN